MLTVQFRIWEVIGFSTAMTKYFYVLSSIICTRIKKLRRHQFHPVETWYVSTGIKMSRRSVRVLKLVRHQQQEISSNSVM